MDFAFRFWLFDWFDPSARAGAHPGAGGGGAAGNETRHRSAGSGPRGSREGIYHQHHEFNSTVLFVSECASAPSEAVLLFGDIDFSSLGRC